MQFIPREKREGHTRFARVSSSSGERDQSVSAQDQCSNSTSRGHVHLPTHVIERASTTVLASGREPRALAARHSEPAQELLEPVDYRAPSSGAGPDAAAIPGIARVGLAVATSGEVAFVVETTGWVAFGSVAACEPDAAQLGGAGRERRGG